MFIAGGVRGDDKPNASRRANDRVESGATLAKLSAMLKQSDKAAAVALHVKADGPQVFERRRRSRSAVPMSRLPLLALEPPIQHRQNQQREQS